MRWIVIAAMSVGCWSHARHPTARLRRDHTPGDVLRQCLRGDATVSVAGTPSIRATTRAIHDVHVLARDGQTFVIRTDIRSGSSRIEQPRRAPIVLARGPRTGVPGTVDALNRTRARVGRAAGPTDATAFDVGFLPRLEALHAMPYPARALRAGDRFPFRHRATDHRPGKVPTTRTTDVEVTVDTIDADRVILTCAGTQREEARRGAEYVRVAHAVRCRIELERASGWIGRWTLDAEGRTEIFGERAPSRIRSRSELAIVPRGNADPVCARAAEP